MWISRYGAQHAHSDVMATATRSRTFESRSGDGDRHGDVIVRVEAGIELPVPKRVPVADTKPPKRTDTGR